MKLNNEYKYVILCEDRQMECFIRYFLEEQGIEKRKISNVDFPGKGCGEQYVREHFPVELKNLRTRNYNLTALFVCIDCDKHDVEDIYKELDEYCKEVKIPGRNRKEPAVIFIPKRNIETWIKYYSGELDIDEIRDYAHFLRGREADCRPAAQKMSVCFMEGDITGERLPSITGAYGEYVHLVEVTA